MKCRRHFFIRSPLQRKYASMWRTGRAADRGTMPLCSVQRKPFQTDCTRASEERRRQSRREPMNATDKKTVGIAIVSKDKLHNESKSILQSKLQSKS